jgi:hypothetical protein
MVHAQVFYSATSQRVPVKKRAITSKNARHCMTVFGNNEAKQEK